MRNSFRINLLVVIGFLLFRSCLHVEQSYKKLAPGTWRAVLELEPHEPLAMKKSEVIRQTEDFFQGELAFNFEVKYIDDDHFFIEISNGPERIRCDSIHFWRAKNSAYDTLVVRFPHYQSHIRAVVRERLMEGEWVVESKVNYRIPFKAKHGLPYRFTNMNEPPGADLTGKWETRFGINEDKPEMAIGEFRQSGNHLEGTWRTETGDYRFLEGTVQGHRFWLSAFDGAHAFLFDGSIRGDTLFGQFRSGTHFKNLWQATRNDTFDLRSADALTRLRPGASGIKFDYATPDGRRVAIPSKEMDGKVKIVQISGTWCPNCLDEAEFLIDYFHKNPSPEVSIISLLWERQKDPKLANQQVARYKKLKNIPWDMVWAGPANRDSVAVRMPELENIMAFPTMIVIDKKNRVRQIHTGFDGPATSRFADFQTDFDRLIKELVAEN